MRAENITPPEGWVWDRQSWRTPEGGPRLLRVVHEATGHVQYLSDQSIFSRSQHGTTSAPTLRATRYLLALKDALDSEAPRFQVPDDVLELRGETPQGPYSVTLRINENTITVRVPNGTFSRRYRSPRGGCMVAHLVSLSIQDGINISLNAPGNSLGDFIQEAWVPYVLPALRRLL